MVSFFGILEKVQLRILSQKPASLPHSSFRAGIDKLNATFTEPIEISAVASLARLQGIECQKVRLKNKHHLKIVRQKCVFLFPLTGNQEYITGFVSNPNQFMSWQNYLSFTESIVPAESLKASKISRLDLNLDFALPFSDLIQQIDIKNKSTATTHEEKAGHRTGLYIGKNPELILIYDKSKKDNLSEPQSRIELRLTGKKVPCYSIYNLPQYISAGDQFTMLAGCKLSFNEIGLTEVQEQKLQEFKTLAKRDGLYASRKFMNQTRNFDRDFAKLIQSTQWAAQPNELFKSQIRSFLDGTM